jgi:hypothetical protein
LVTTNENRMFDDQGFHATRCTNFGPPLPLE